MFNWLKSLNLDSFNNIIRFYIIQHKNTLPEWLLFSLPDGLWVFSYTTLILLIWKNKINIQNIFWIIIIPAIAVLSEIAQYYKLIKGTFDIIDLTFYISGLIFPLIFFTNNLIIIKKRKE